MGGGGGGGCRAGTVTPPHLNIVSDDGWIVFSIIQHKKFFNLFRLGLHITIKNYCF